MLNFVERTSDFFGRLAAWMFFVIGGMLTYEVIARRFRRHYGGTA